jgi:RNA 2',3'-cyclic 3'-phosphodiesterase
MQLPRIFFAVPLPDSVKGKLAALQCQLMQKTGVVKWVEKENMHLTLLFLGDVPPERLKTVIAGASKAAATAQPFLLEIKGLGAFPSQRNPRVLWAGVESGASEASSLAEALSQCIGVRQDRPFSAHLTLGRVREGRQVRLEEIRESQWQFEAGTVMVDSFLCLESKLTPRGPVYNNVAVLKLSRI